ncbi:UDP-N-acetylmuramyl-tripeptide synthetase [Sphaerotilus natans subsp. natans DSM 6575]|uniref:UDP-N-acetylmuramoyl-L-alanyl-D-glutamate--2,6-diaminopimelate ligase n=1 Tax=Sphaerotilus natans subsp. natans DSM 6575 TaxID=1286631 RepID=A0A059KN35_9BURK|nr:UDP-N-acetylmuramoyl-L-alanyl-D-glutamate--2,6-diaminopimelate ligase [Sphaerotilus natans]KDB52871.1 UDP-N-acetylmuramyl-tripeptide synthetase [Sphaerotilus natans subsp. natans DSM 6575]SIR60687.1 UDP-N-acetylmuramoylalanyl-D-glutamate--2,6-diaminopimelate ligase [Sphaerotilus natans]
MGSTQPTLLTFCRDVDETLAWLRRVAPQAVLRTDSRQVLPGDVFIAWPGAAQDGRRHVPAALAAGAAACLVEADGVEAFDFGAAAQARIAALPALKAATAPLAAAWHDHPSRRLDVVATTGTNGKTSTAWWLAQALSLAGRRCGVVGTLGVGEPPSRVAPEARVISTGLTTPDPVTLQRALRDFAARGFAACAMEASSIGVTEHRLDAVKIDVALFTNFTPDHLDYHGSMAAYWQAKRALFDWPGLRAAVINIDDPQGAILADELQAAGRIAVWTCSTRPSARPARLQASDLRYDGAGLCLRLAEQGEHADAPVEVRTALIGDYNAANVVGVIGVLRALGLPLAEVAALAADFTPVPGRMQRVEPPAGAADLPQVVVDYAHTPDALEKALQALRPFAQARGGRLWCVFGCGGNRDATKRPVMGRIAQALADEVVLTSDNPRHEAPAAILGQILAGCTSAPTLAVIEDRAAAIATVLHDADEADVVLIAGKGHEDYQETAGVRHHFSDLEQAEAALQRRTSTAA